MSDSFAGVQRETEMKFYLSGRYRDRLFYQGIRQKLQHMGHEVTSTWIDEDATLPPESIGTRFVAERDVREIGGSDVVLSDTREPFSPHSGGGREFERGIAYGRGIHLWRVGPKRQAFHFLDEEEFHDWDAFFAFLIQLPTQTRDS